LGGQCSGFVHTREAPQECVAQGSSKWASLFLRRYTRCGAALVSALRLTYRDADTFALGATVYPARQTVLLILSLTISGCTQTGGPTVAGTVNNYVPPLATPAAQPFPPPSTAPSPPNYRRLSLQLKPGMSEQDATNLMGQASQSSLTTCGQSTGSPWSCKIWTYGMGYGPLGTSLSVIFGQNQSGAWLVAGWQ